ncbi:MAG: hypothetical protein NT061_01795 [Spirochaetes bacterium]|nr:hypothetical protein [Spirochaetota bacterium]
MKVPEALTRRLVLPSRDTLRKSQPDSVSPPYENEMFVAGPAKVKVVVELAELLMAEDLNLPPLTYQLPEKPDGSVVESKV